MMIYIGLQALYGIFTPDNPRTYNLRLWPTPSFRKPIHNAVAPFIAQMHVDWHPTLALLGCEILARAA
jgi:hypothetical protein